MNRRLPNTKPMGETSYDRGDEPRAACEGETELYDYLIDGRANERPYRLATEQAREICATCPIFGKCMTDNRDEVWVKAILGERIVRNTVSERRTREHTERTKWRVEVVQRVIDQGGPLEEALRWTGLTPKGFYSWCRRNRLLDLYAALTADEDRKPNQHRRNGAAA